MTSLDYQDYLTRLKLIFGSNVNWFQIKDIFITFIYSMKNQHLHTRLYRVLLLRCYVSSVTPLVSRTFLLKFRQKWLHSTVVLILDYPSRSTKF